MMQENQFLHGRHTVANPGVEKSSPSPSPLVGKLASLVGFPAMNSPSDECTHISLVPSCSLVSNVDNSPYSTMVIGFMSRYIASRLVCNRVTVSSSLVIVVFST